MISISIKEKTKSLRLAGVITLVALLAGSCENSTLFDSFETGRILSGKELPLNAISINNATDLAKICTDPAYPANGDYVLVDSLTLINWTPIGAQSGATGPFTGTFDGDGNTLTINSYDSGTTANAQFLGIFSELNGATVQNLNVAAGAISFSSGTVQAMGILAGQAVNAIINSVNASGSFTVQYTGGAAKTNSLDGGGIAGNADRTGFNNCAGTASVTVNVPNGGYSAGGWGITGYMTRSNISDSHTTGGDITVSVLTASGNYNQAYAGGLAGYSGSKSLVDHCYSTGQTVTVNNTAYPYAGGLVGYNYGEPVFEPTPVPPPNGIAIERSWSANTVIAAATDNGLPYAGGLAAYNAGVNSLIRNCYATGNVTASSGGQYAWAGGVAGCVAANAALLYTYATGNVTATAGSGTLPYSQPVTNPGAAAAGIVGYTYNYFGTGNVTSLENSVGLNSAVSAGGSSAVNAAHRVAGHNGYAATPPDTQYDSLISNNAGNAAMSLSPAPSSPDPALDGGASTAAPPQSFYQSTLGWNFTSVWQMNGTIYPTLR